MAKQLLRIFMIFGMVYGIGIGEALAYIDPSSGTHFIQMLVIGFMGMLFVVKAYWLKITLFMICNKF